MIAYIEHHTEYYGWGCSVFDNDEDFNLVDISQWYYLCGQAKPNYPMPAIRREVRFIPYKDEVWTGYKTTLTLVILKPHGFGFICERYWFNT